MKKLFTSFIEQILSSMFSVRLLILVIFLSGIGLVRSYADTNYNSSHVTVTQYNGFLQIKYLRWDSDGCNDGLNWINFWYLNPDNNEYVLVSNCSRDGGPWWGGAWTTSSGDKDYTVFNWYYPQGLFDNTISLLFNWSWSNQIYDCGWYDDDESSGWFWKEQFVSEVENYYDKIYSGNYTDQNLVDFYFPLCRAYGNDVYHHTAGWAPFHRHELDDIYVYYQHPTTNAWVEIFHGDCDNSMTDFSLQCFTKTDEGVVDASDTRWDNSSELYAWIRWSQIPSHLQGHNVKFRVSYMWDTWPRSTNDSPVGTKDFTYYIPVKYEPQNFNVAYDTCEQTVNLDWTIPSSENNRFINFNVDKSYAAYAHEPFEEYGRTYTASNVDKATTFSDTNITPGESYFYSVVTHYNDDTYWFDRSDAARVDAIATPVLPSLFTVEDYSAVQGDDAIKVAWSYDCGCATTLVLERTNNDSGLKQLITLNPDDGIYIDADIQACVSYSYMLKATSKYTSLSSPVQFITVEYSYNIEYINVGSLNPLSNPDNYGCDNTGISLSSPNDSNGYSFLGWYSDMEFNQLAEGVVVEPGERGDTVFYAKWERNPFAAFGEYEDPLKLKLTQSTDSLALRLFLGNFSNPDTSLSLKNVRLCYLDTDSDVEVELFEATLEDGNFADTTVSSSLADKGKTYANGNDFQNYMWGIDREKFSVIENVEFRLYANWEIVEGANVKIDSIKHSPLVINHKAFDLPEAMYVNVPINLTTELEENVDSMEWTLEQESLTGKAVSYNVSSVSELPLSVVVYYNDNSTKTFDLGLVSIEELPELSLLDDFVPTAYNADTYSFTMEPLGAIGEVYYSVDSGSSIPWGVYLDNANGEFYWRESRIGVYNFTLKATDVYEGYERSVTKGYTLTIVPNTSVTISENVREGFPFEVSKESDYEPDMWLWQLEGQEDVYTLYTQRYTINTPGTYDLTLTPAIKNDAGGYSLQEAYKMETEVLVEPIAEGFMKVSHDKENDHITIESFTDLATQFTTNMPNGFAVLSIEGLPEGASFNNLSGMLRWNRVSAGSYYISVTSTRLRTFETNTKSLEITVNPPTFSDVSLYIHNDKGEVIEGAMVVCGNNADTTNTSGIVEFSLMDLNSHEVKISHVDYTEKTQMLFVTEDTIMDVELKPSVLVLQNVQFTADRINKDKSISTLIGNAAINDMIYFEANSAADTTVTIDMSSDVMPLITTYNNVRYKGDLSSRYLINNTLKKQFYLYQGLLIPKGNTIFDLGEVGSIPFDGYMMSFYADEDEDGFIEDFGVEFAVFPRLPWVIGDYVSNAGYQCRDMVMGLLRGANLDIEQIMAKSEEGQVSYTPLDKKLTKTPEDPDEKRISNAAYQDSTMTGLWSKLKMIQPSMPSIEVMKRYGYYDGESHSISIQEIEICYKAFGLENLGITYEYNKQTGRTAWGGSAYLNFGAKCKGYKSGATREDEYITFDQLQENLQESFDEFPEIEEVDIVMSDKSGQVVYESSYGEFVDITDQVREGEYDIENRLFKGIGAEILIINGKLDKIYLSADVSVPLGPVTIKNLNGGVSGLTGEDDLTITFGATMTLTANKYVKFKELQATVTPWSYYAFEGKLELYSSELLFAEMSYNSNRKQFYVGGEIIPQATKGVITGRVELGLGAKGIGGNAICNVKTPSELPSFFSWAANRHVGSAAVGFSDRYVGAKVAIGREITTEVTVQERRGWWSSAWKKVKNAVRWVTKRITTFMSFELSVGYDFDTNNALFGNNVKIPKAIRMCYRGDTLIQDFVVEDPIKMLYITSSSAIDTFVSFEIYNPDNKQVIDDVVWGKDSVTNEMIAIVTYPEIGTWRVKLDTTGITDVNIIAMYMDGAPQGMFESPLSRDTSIAEVMVRFNDINDTLDVGIYLDNDKAGFNGSLIKDLKVLNKASLKFTYAPQLLEPGEYFFYYTVVDKSGVPEYKYADGSIVILPSNTASPRGVKNEFFEDSLVITWETTDTTMVDYVSVELTDLKTGEMIAKEVWDTTLVSFDNLILSHNYKYSVRNKSITIGTSDEIVGEVLLLSALQNNPPMWNMIDGTGYLLYEAESFQLFLDAVDPEGLTLSIINTSSNVPKSVEITNGIMNWIPTADECGVYEFTFAASDGVLSDTISLGFEVQSKEKAAVGINFASTKLYEEDNMFLILSDATSTDSLKTAWLHNISKQDSILVKMTRSDDKTYMGHFQLSYQRRSILPVSNGDTLLAEYFFEGDTAYAISFFDSLPQLPDNVSPDAITDLEILSIGDYIAATFTVPEDRMDNGLLANPFYYDLRYAYRRLDSEEVYLSSFSIESYNVGVPGTRDTIYFEIGDLLDYDSSYRVWFNVKAGDPNYNISDMSNTDSMDYIIAPSNLSASLQAGQKGVDLEWDGVEKIEGDDFFEHYEVYRKFGAEDYELIAYSDITAFEDDFTNPVQDGVLTYAVRAVYKTNITDYVYSSQVNYDRYSNIRIKYYDERNVRSSGEMSYVILDPYYDVVKTGVFNADGQSYEEDFANGDYVLQIYSGSTMQITDDITVSASSSYFEYVLEDGFATSILDIKKTDVLELFPNPAENELFIRVNNAVDNRDFEMYDVCGNKVLLTIIPREIGVDYSLYSVDVSSLSDGVYFISVEGEESSNKTSQVVRFMKK